MVVVGSLFLHLCSGMVGVSCVVCLLSSDAEPEEDWDLELEQEQAALHKQQPNKRRSARSSRLVIVLDRGV